MKIPVTIATLLCAFLMLGGVSGAVSTDFELLGDLEHLTTPIAGATFANAVGLQSFSAALGTLDDSQFPPFSRITVVSNGTADALSGSIIIDFGAPVSAVSGRFTYASALTLTAFDAGGEVASVA